MGDREFDWIAEILTVILDYGSDVAWRAITAFPELVLLVMLVAIAAGLIWEAENKRPYWLALGVRGAILFGLLAMAAVALEVQCRGGGYTLAGAALVMLISVFKRGRKASAIQRKRRLWNWGALAIVVLGGGLFLTCLSGQF